MIQDISLCFFGIPNMNEMLFRHIKYEMIEIIYIVDRYLVMREVVVPA